MSGVLLRRGRYASDAYVQRKGMRRHRKKSAICKPMRQAQEKTNMPIPRS